VRLAAERAHVLGRLREGSLLLEAVVVLVGVWAWLGCRLWICRICDLPTLSNSKPRQPFFRPIWIRLNMTFRTAGDVVSNQFYLR
jgi:hypothetical protein